MRARDIKTVEGFREALKQISGDSESCDDRDADLVAPFFRAGYVLIGFGCYRAVFAEDETYVIKVALNNQGTESNHREAEAYGGHEAGRYDLFPAPVAPCELVDVLGIEVLRMVRVKTLREVPAQDELPAWIACIDNEQAGYLPDGRLVAYDL